MSLHGRVAEAELQGIGFLLGGQSYKGSRGILYGG